MQRQGTSLTTDDDFILPNKIALDDESSTNAYFSALDDLTHQNMFVSASEAENEVKKIDNISEEDVTYQDLSNNVRDSANFDNEDDKSCEYDTIINTVPISSNCKEIIESNNFCVSANPRDTEK